MTNKLRLLLAAYPLLPVSQESCGGAEQLLVTLEGELARRGHRTTVAACAGSKVAGECLATSTPPCSVNHLEERQQQHARSILRFLEAQQRSCEPFHLVHDHSGEFWRHAGHTSVPVLATLHLPRNFYPAGSLEAVPENIFFNCVSFAQLRDFADVPQVVGAVCNGIRLEDFPFCSRKDDYLLWMGRLCEEKGAHIAIRVARAAGMKLVIAGGVYPFSYHMRYFEREILPHIEHGGEVTFVKTPAPDLKRRLLGEARALLVPSLVDETSSLAAMEAMACGTPVIAFHRGALPEVVAHGVTGFLALSEQQMIEAIAQVSQIDPARCRRHAEAHFSSRRMATEYEALYGRVLTAHGKQAVTSSAGLGAMHGRAIMAKGARP